MKENSKINEESVAVIITAAGSSTRMKASVKKEYLPLKDGTVLSEAVKPFLKTLFPKYLVITYPSKKAGEDFLAQTKGALFSDREIEDLLGKTELTFEEGGSSRQSSIFKALVSLNKKTQKPKIVLIHDGARPFIDSETIKRTLKDTVSYGAAVPALTPTDTQKEKDSCGFIKEHLERKKLAAVQTPQGFDFETLFKAHEKASTMEKEFTDDTEIYALSGKKIKITEGNEENIKITYAKDYSGEETMKEIRTGLGYDLHRLIEGRKLVVGGIELPFEKGEDGHSDGDALLHAITDALLGASGLGDIGSYFPPEDAKWKDADSKELLKTVWKDVKNEGWRLGNLDCVIKLEKPKFLPHRNEVIKSIANILDTDEKRIFVKAKTGEKLGDIGEERAIEVWATCLLQK